MTRLLLFVAVLLTASALTAQTVIFAQEQDPITADTLTAESGLAFSFDVRNIYVRYTSVDALGNPDTLSGLVCIPDADLVYPLGVYCHGTVFDREAVPSREGVRERLLPQFMAGLGILTVAPDYVGLGDSDGFHPYVHAASEVSAARDMLTAVRAWRETQNGEVFNGQLFLTGYSQGGHATQALHRSLQEDPAPDLTVTGGTHLSGPYDISGTMVNTVFDTLVPTTPGFIPYAFISYNNAYEVYDDLGEVFVDPYLPLIRRFANEELSFGEFATQIGQDLAANDDIIAGMFQDSILTLLEERPAGHPFLAALEDNDTYDWAPQSQTVIFYCTEDEQVPPVNAFIADSVFRANGSVSVLLQSGGPLNHLDCVDPAIGLTLTGFRIFAQVIVNSLGAVDTGGDLSVYPNPVAAGRELYLNGSHITTRPFVLYDAAGRVSLRGTTSASGRVRLPATLAPGVAFLRVGLANGTSAVRRLVIR